MHILPKDGGLLDQDELAIQRLITIFDHLDEYRKVEMEKASKTPASTDRPRG